MWPLIRTVDFITYYPVTVGVGFEKRTRLYCLGVLAFPLTEKTDFTYRLTVENKLKISIYIVRAAF